MIFLSFIYKVKEFTISIWVAQFNVFGYRYRYVTNIEEKFSRNSEANNSLSVMTSSQKDFGHIQALTIFFQFQDEASCSVSCSYQNSCVQGRS